MMISDAHLLDESIPTINKQDYSLMECESLYGSDYFVETESGRARAAVECFFGGYYPNEPSTEM